MKTLELVTITVIPAKRCGQKVAISFIGWPKQIDLLRAIELEVTRIQVEAEEEAENLDVPVADVLESGIAQLYGLVTQIIQTCPVDQFALSAPIGV